VRAEGEPEPIREALDARGFARGERAVLRRVDEHEAVLAQMRDDGAARFATALAGVAILEVLLGIRPLEDHAAPHRLGGVFALVEQGEVAQVAGAVRTGAVRGEQGASANSSTRYR